MRPPSTSASRCRALLRDARTEWRRGRAEDAWRALDEAELLQGAAPSLPVEVLAARAGVHLLAEEPATARALAERALTEAKTRRTSGHLRVAVADARVTLATLGGPAGGDRERDHTTLRMIAEDPDLIGAEPAARALNNALILATDLAKDRLVDPAVQVDLWMQVSAALAIAPRHAHSGTILRQGVDLAFATGHWERGWDLVRRSLDESVDVNEIVSVHAKAAELAWERGMLDEAREHGDRARRSSITVELPWVRTYAYLGGVIHAAAAGRSLAGALDAYARCTTAAGHATRPERAWKTAHLALDAGHPPDDVEAFLARVVPDLVAGRTRPRVGAVVRVVLAEARGKPLDPEDVGTLAPWGVVDRAKILSVLAGDARRSGRPTAAATMLFEARRLLHNWPGRTLDAVVAGLAGLGTDWAVTPAQRAVLALVADGLPNAGIARALGCSERTVAVHVSALLRASGARSRTELAVLEVRRRFAEA